MFVIIQVRPQSSRHSEICQAGHPVGFSSIITGHIFMDLAKLYSFTHGQPVLTWPPPVFHAMRGSVYI